jgi:hypothetical protein
MERRNNKRSRPRNTRLAKESELEALRGMRSATAKEVAYWNKCHLRTPHPRGMPGQFWNAAAFLAEHAVSSCKTVFTYATKG